MDFALNEREKMVQNAAREFAQRSVLPRAAEIDRTSEFPRDLADEMGRMGYYGLPFSPEYGGCGAGYTAYALVIEQLSRASMTAGAFVAVSILSEESIYRYGNERQKKEHLVPLTSGSIYGCFCFTEPATGSDPKAIATRARPDGEDYVIDGQKSFIAVAPMAAQALVFAEDESARVSAFVVPTSSKGFVLREACETLGLRGLAPSVIYFDGVRIPGQSLLGKKGGGFDILLEAISVERLGVAAQCVGVSQAALDLAVDYSKQRVAYNKPISGMPTVQWLLAEMASRAEAGRWLTYRTAFLRDTACNIQSESSVAKLFCSQMAVDVTRMAMQVHGAYATMKTMPIERLYRDAKMAELYVGVSEIQRAIIANHVLTG